MDWYALLRWTPLLAGLGIAAVVDWRTRRIPNWLTLGLALAGIAQSFSAGAVVSPWTAGLGLLCGFALTLPRFILGAMGGGDVKLMSAIGAWLGPVRTLEVFVIEAVIGLVIVLIQCTAKRRLGMLFRNSAVIAVNLAHVKDFGVDHVAEAGRSRASVDRPLPHAVPLSLAVVVLIALMSIGRA